CARSAARCPATGSRSASRAAPHSAGSRSSRTKCRRRVRSAAANCSAAAPSATRRSRRSRRWTASRAARSCARTSCSARGSGVPEARLVETGPGVAPQVEGWFVVNAADATWLRHDEFGARCTFEVDGRLAAERPEIDVQQPPQLGFRLHVLEPGKPSTMYHRESSQEGFLVLSGECLLIVNGEERPLRAWDFFHAPPNTTHAFVGAGDGPCVMVMVGARSEDGTILY